MAATGVASMAEATPDAAAQEADRIRAVYAGARRKRRAAANTWRWANKRLRTYRRDDAIARSLIRAGFTDLEDVAVIDVGCGNGAWLRSLIDWGVAPENIHGCDVVEDRVASAAASLPPVVEVRMANAMALPWDDASFDLAFAQTVFSSVLDLPARTRIAEELWRVVRPGGMALVYDFVWSSPRNPDTCGIGGGEIRRLFVTAPVRSRRVNLLPPLARRFPAWASAASLMLEVCAPFLCSHRVYAIGPKASVP